LINWIVKSKNMIRKRNRKRNVYYSYDAGGERTYKMQLTEVMAQTNTYGGKYLEVEKLALYPNGYINIDQYGNYTKHYYAESQRVASKIGGGSSRSMTDTMPRLQDYLTSQTGNGEVPIGIGVIGGGESVSTIPYYLTLPSHLRKYLEDVVLPHDTIAQIIFDTVRITHLMGADSIGLENELFFYHGDHLSSTQMITDANGAVQQQVLYAPFGEVISEYNAYWHQGKVPDYMFNAKEKEEESGMYYYSARYYAPPVFISRDPLFEKYPFMSPYAYCANNPVIYIDPDGRRIIISYQDEKQKNTQIVYYHKGRLYTDLKYRNEYAGNNTFFDDVLSDLNNIASKGGELKNRLNTLVGSENTHTITVGKENQNGVPKEAIEEGAKTGSTTYYHRDPNKVSQSRSSLVHELLGHGYSADQGCMKEGVNTILDAGNGNSTYLDQIWAIDIQNVYNKSVGLPLRTTDKNIKTGQMFDLSKYLNLNPVNE
jgi:RHS repeat-associated protein